MEWTDLERNLLQAIETWDIIDCHEHLGSEGGRTKQTVDVFSLFRHYTRGDIALAGMRDTDYQSLFNQDIPLDRRWSLFEPYWERIRWGSYARAVLLAAQRFYDVEDINRETYEPLTRAMQQANQPGIYERVLREACKIQVALTQCGSTDLGTSLLVPVMPMVYDMETWDALAHPTFAPGSVVRSLDDYLDTIREYILRVKREGAVGSSPGIPVKRTA